MLALICPARLLVFQRESGHHDDSLRAPLPKLAVLAMLATTIRSMESDI